MNKNNNDVPLTMGAALALRENLHKYSNAELIVEKATELAISRSRKDGYEPAVKRIDIEQAIKLIIK